MQVMRKLLKGGIAVVAAVAAGAAVWLIAAPPELLRVADGYSAKIVCSNVFLAGRDPRAVLESDVQAPGNPVLKFIRAVVDRDEKIVTAKLFGFFAPETAVYRDGLGCASVPDGNIAAAKAITLPAVPAIAAAGGVEWPEGDQVSAGNAAVAAVIGDAALAGPGMRAVVVVKDGRIIAETYDEGFAATTPLLGWSMTKTVNAAIIGRLMLDSKMTFDDDRLLPQWQTDARASIRLRDLLAMESGLQFNESYGAVSDVTRMLYLEPDMAKFAVSGPLWASPGTSFNYLSVNAVLLSRIWMDRLADQTAALAYPRDALFRPLGMNSAVLEADARGTFVGSSYLYATARDWARFALFLLRDGVWNGQRLLPEGFTAAMQTPSVASKGIYTHVQAWRAGPGDRPSKEFGLPEDTYWMQGHDGQSVAIVPSANLIVVRLGLTPKRTGYRPQLMLKAILDALNPASG